MVNLELVALKVKCERQYQTIVKLQDEKIDLFKENQQLKEVIEEARIAIDYMIGNVDISEIHGTKLKQILDRAGDIDEKKN